MHHCSCVVLASRHAGSHDTLSMSGCKAMAPPAEGGLVGGYPDAWLGPDRGTLGPFPPPSGRGPIERTWADAPHLTPPTSPRRIAHAASPQGVTHAPWPRTSQAVDHLNHQRVCEHQTIGNKRSRGRGGTVVAQTATSHEPLMSPTTPPTQCSCSQRVQVASSSPPACACSRRHYVQKMLGSVAHVFERAQDSSGALAAPSAAPCAPRDHP